MGYHRTRFSRIRSLMLERDRLTSNLFIVALIRSDEGWTVLRDMIALYRQDTEVAFRSNLKLEKCRCPTTSRK
jgi:Ni,Fe-hydrogenase III large subunit